MRLVEFLKENWKGVLILILTAILVFTIRACSINQDKVNEKDNLITALNDTLRVTRGKDGESVGTITPIITGDINDFLDLQVKGDIKQLQDLVQQYRKELKDKGVAIVYAGETKYDTIWRTKPDGRTIDSINNKWITSRFGFENGNTIFNLRVRDSLQIVIGEESQGWFKPKKPFAQVTSQNPYSEVQSFRTYNVSQDKKSGLTIDLGLYTGFGATYTDKQVKFGPQAGGGITINF